MKTVKVDHVVLTLSLGTPASQGMKRDEVNELVNKRLAEGYTEVSTSQVRTNADERGQATDVVILYIFKQNVEDEVVESAAKSKKA